VLICVIYGNPPLKNPPSSIIGYLAYTINPPVELLKQNVDLPYTLTIGITPKLLHIWINKGIKRVY